MLVVYGDVLMVVYAGGVWWCINGGVLMVVYGGGVWWWCMVIVYGGCV